MQLGEAKRRHASQAAVGPDFVVVRTPGSHGRSGLMQGLKPRLVQMLITELAVETLDVDVLHGAPWLDQDMANAAGLRPGNESAAGELWPVIGAHCLRIPAKQRRPIQYPRHVLARDAKVHRNVHALMAKVIGHGEVLQAPPARQAVAHKIHAPDLVDCCCQLQRHALGDGPLSFLAPAHGQVGLAVEAIHPLVIDTGKLRAQQIVNAPVSKAATQMGNFQDLFAQILVVLIELRWMAVAVAGEPHKSARVAFGNSAKVLEFAEHAFDDMALLVHVPVTASLHFAFGFGWNHCRDVALYEPVEQDIGVIPFVSQQRAGAHALHEGHGLSDVRCLASRQDKAHGQTQRICQRVNLATKTATRAAQRFSSRVARGRARTTVLSMQTFCISSLSETLASICSHTPNRLQLENRLNTLFQCPSLSGRSRHWAPERNIHSTASTNRRQVASHPIRMPGVFFSLPIKWTHSLSLNLLLSMTAQKLKILLFATSTEPSSPKK